MQDIYIFLLITGIGGISYSNYTPQLIQSHTGDNYETGHIKIILRD